MSANRMLFAQMSKVPDLVVPPGKVLLELTKDELLFIGVALKLLNAAKKQPELEDHIVAAYGTFQ